MKYKNGKDVLPPDLLAEIQRYLCGEMLYIPKREEIKAAWGQLSGSKEEVRNRNIQIANMYQSGSSVDELTDQFCLSESSIRKIIYTYKNEQ